jgi:hypothetical protein
MSRSAYDSYIIIQALIQYTREQDLQQQQKYDENLLVLNIFFLITGHYRGK